MKPLREKLELQDVTIFVPSNYAFEKLSPQKKMELLADEERLFKVDYLRSYFNIHLLYAGMQTFIFLSVYFI